MCTIPCHIRGHINVLLVLQICVDSLQVMAGSSTEAFPTSCDGTCDVGDIKVEEDMDVQDEEKVNVKAEEEECIGIKHKDGIYSEEEEGIDTKEGKDVDVKEEVSCEDTL